MLKIIEDNPYRELGVYATSSRKDIVANQGRMKALIRVGKACTFPLDLPSLLPPVVRTEESVAYASTQLALPQDQLKYAQFWFVKATSLDDIAFNHLLNGNIDLAVEIWTKKDCVSSLQNRIVCGLIKKEYGEALSNAEKLYGGFSKDFVNLVLGDNATVAANDIEYTFLDILCEELDAKDILKAVSSNAWREYVEAKSVQPLIDKLMSAIETAKQAKGNGAAAKLTAGTKLMTNTKPLLAQLRQFLPTTDLKYQMVADKLGNEILQCGIDYYNDSEDDDAAFKAKTLQDYAASIVVGKIAKDRCKENVDILNDIINNLPPKEVMAEDKAIKEELRKFCKLPDKICHAITLLNNTKPHLQAIKSKLGSNNSFYLKISTQVVGNALHNLIEEVNAVQDDPSVKLHILIDKALALVTIQRVLCEAWKATQIMDSFDMEYDFKTNRYNKQRSALRNLCSDFGASTYSSPSRPASRPSSSTDSSGSSSYAVSSSSSSDDIPWGCLIPIIIAILIGLMSQCH